MSRNGSIRFRSLGTLSGSGPVCASITVHTIEGGEIRPMNDVIDRLVGIGALADVRMGSVCL